jgi:F-type H+-transporting ATPase subunit b
MAKSGNSKDVIELWGQSFHTVSNGLDENEVVVFVSDLMKERDTLAKQADHVSSLTKLAEKTIVEADQLAEEIKGESLSQAKEEADTIIAKAEEQARQLAGEKRTEILNTAAAEAEAIKANAAQEAELLLERERERIQPQIRAVAQRLYGELLSQLEGLKHQVTELDEDFGQKLSLPVETASAVTAEEEDAITLAAESPIDLESDEEVSDEPQQPAQATEQIATNQVEPEVAPAATNQEEITCENEVELEVLPPIDIKQIMGVLRYLDGLAEVEDTELIPLTEKPLIVVFLREPISLTEILKSLPEIDEAEEVTPVTDAARAEGKRRRIQVTLAENPVLAEATEKVGS